MLVRRDVEFKHTHARLYNAIGGTVSRETPRNTWQLSGSTNRRNNANRFLIIFPSFNTMASHNIYFLLTLFCFFFAIQASPSPLTANTISISLITPNGHTEWKVGARETVTWKVKGYVMRVRYNVLTAENSMIQGVQPLRIPLRSPRIVSI